MQRSWWSNLPRGVRWPIVAVALAAGVASTAPAMFIGLDLADAMTHTCWGSKANVARLRAKANRDAVEQFVAVEHRCPRTHDELVSGGYLFRRNVRGPWGTPIVFLCMTSPSDTNVTAKSAGPDRVFGTLDDAFSGD